MPENHSGMGVADRRQILKSAPMLIGYAKTRAQNTQTPAIRQKMMGGMLPHKQFPAPQLAEFGVSTERPRFDLLYATIVNLHPGEVDPVRLIDFYGREVLPKLKRSKNGS